MINNFFKKAFSFGATLAAIFFLMIFLSGCGAKIQTVKINVDTNTNANAAGQASSTSPCIEKDGACPLPLTGSGGRATEVVPTKVLLAAPFVTQAPFANWDGFHEETCEEASMISAEIYFKKQKIDAATIDKKLHEIVDWETARGYGIDLGAADVVTILKEYYGIKARLETEVTTDRIKYELAQGRLIIAPAAGRLLGNPYFTGLGPIYHMLVVKGYDSKNFITNDVGTNTKGENFPYPYSRLLGAIHDWSPALSDGGLTQENMEKGAKAIVVVEGEI